VLNLFSSLFSAQLSVEWIENKGYQDWMVGTGFVIGVVSGCLCFMILLTIGVCKQLFNRIRSRLANPFLKEVLPPVIGGIAIGEFLFVGVGVLFLSGYRYNFAHTTLI